VIKTPITDLALVQPALVVEPAMELRNPDHPLPDRAARAIYEDVFERFYQAGVAAHEREQPRLHGEPESSTNSSGSKTSPRQRVRSEVVDEGWSYICDGGRVPTGGFEWYQLKPHVFEVVGDLQPLHAFRLIRLVGPYVLRFAPFPARLDDYRRTSHPTPLELQAAAEQAGFSRRHVLNSMPAELPWSDDDTGQWVMALLPYFVDIISSGETDYGEDIAKYYDAVRCLPTLPTDLRQTLLTQALSGQKPHRSMAKAVLAGDQDLVGSVTQYLGSSHCEERTQAGIWLGEIGDIQAGTALHEAAAKEKEDHAKGAILTALENLGEPVDQHVDRGDLLAEATRGMAKKVPSLARWVPLDSLGGLRWDDGSPVDSVIPQWLVVQAVRLKSPTPSPIVRRYFAQMNRTDVETFANTILAIWLAEDVRPISVDAATDLATQQSQRIRSQPELYDRLALMSDDQLMAHLIKRHLSVPAGSAVGSKGILSLAGAGGGVAVVAPIEAYIRKWYGRRMSQCKALVTALAWIDDPTATQLVLSLATRFRTKGIQQEALRQAELLAERKGRTLEDLAYWAVPSGGFDANGSQVFDYGKRQFTARLGDDLVVTVVNPKGKLTKALPAAHKGEDEDLVKQAKKDLSDAKKQIRKAVKEQSLRLHEAMSVQHWFGADDYRGYVLGHPVMARLAARLVWVALNPNEDSVLFRPLSDGTLLDSNDDEISLDAAVSVRVAHGAIDGEVADAAWIKHFVDYQVVPLFPQFGRPQVPDLLPGQELLTDCRGAIIHDRRFRSIIAGLGYMLGPIEDGGVFSGVRRRFPSVGVEVQITVRGLNAVSMDVDVALECVRFTRINEFRAIALAEVPPVLLVETIAEVDQIIAAGDGIDKNWETRVAW